QKEKEEQERKEKEAKAERQAAQRDRAAAQDARKLAEKRAKSLDSRLSRADKIKSVSTWIGLTAVIILTASGEWKFASLVGLGDTPIGDAGWALPVGLDVYA
ncbi:hypothetical protein ADL27_53490, partial [Streptomyces sp. NRRL F-6602]